MIRSILLAQVDVPPDALQTLTDALGMHSTLGYVVAGVLAVLILLPLLLKALGKNVPILDAVIVFLFGLLKSLVKKREVEVVKAEVEEKGVDGVAQVHDINELKGPKL